MLVGTYIGIDIDLLKDISIIIILVILVIYNNYILKVKNINLYIYIIFSFYLLILFLISGNLPAAISFRDILLPITFAFSIYSLKSLPNINLIKHIKILLLTFCLFGFVELIMLHEFLTQIKGMIQGYGSAGNIIYETSSFTKYGIVRMSGLSTGPNDYGLMISFLLFVFIVCQKRKYYFDRLLIGVGGFCLLLSVSRAGIVFLLLSLSFYFFYKWGLILFIKNLFTKENFKYLIIVLIVGISIGYTTLSYFKIDTTSFISLYEASVKLEDASSEARFDQIGEGLIDAIVTEREFINLFGDGLGRSDQRYDHIYEVKFYESSWINMIYEIGLLNFSLFLLIIFILFRSQISRSYSLAFLLVGIFSINPTSTTFLLFTFFVISFLDKKTNNFKLIHAKFNYSRCI